MYVVARLGAGDPATRPVRCGDPPVQGGGQLQHDVGAAGPTVVEVRRQLGGDLVGEHADIHGKTRLPEPVQSPTGDLGIRIPDADDHPGHPGPDYGVGARRGPAVVVARLERRVQGGAGRGRSGRLEGHALGM